MPWGATSLRLTGKTMSDVAVWLMCSEAIKKIVKATLAGVALAVAVGGLLAWWPFEECPGECIFIDCMDWCGLCET